MKNLIKTAKITSLSLLAIISLTAGIMATSSTAQAGPWIALNANACQPSYSGEGGTKVSYYTYKIRPRGGTTSIWVYCPLKLEEVGGDKTVRVWINYKRIDHSGDVSDMACELHSSDYFGNFTATSFSMFYGNSASSVKNINSPYGGTISVYCYLRDSAEGTDELYSFNYRIL